MKYVVSLILTFTLAGNALAGSCSQPVYHLNPGQPAPCEVYGFSLDKEKEVRLMSEDYKLLQDESSLKDKQLDLYKKELVDMQDALSKETQSSQMWKASANESAEKYRAVEERQGIRDWIWLISGIALTVLAGYAVGSAHR